MRTRQKYARDSAPADRPPHPNPLPASGEREELLHRHPLLQALTGIDFAGIKVAVRVELADVHPMEFAALAARPAEGADHGAVAAAHRFQYVVGAVDQDEKILLL